MALSKQHDVAAPRRPVGLQSKSIDPARQTSSPIIPAVPLDLVGAGALRLPHDQPPHGPTGDIVDEQDHPG